MEKAECFLREVGRSQTAWAPCACHGPGASELVRSASVGHLGGIKAYSQPCD